jgi:hypothetical protein
VSHLFLVLGGAPGSDARICTITLLATRDLDTLWRTYFGSAGHAESYVNRIDKAKEIRVNIRPEKCRKTGRLSAKKDNEKAR